MRKLIIFLMGFSLLYAGVVHISSDFVEPEDDIITYSGNVSAFIDEDNVHLWASTLTVSKYAGDWRKIKALGMVSIKTRSMIATSDELNYDLQDKKGTLSGSATVFLTNDNATVLTNSLDFDLNRDFYASYKRSTMFRKDVVATSNTFTYDGSVMVLKGDVEAKSEETNLFGDRAVLNLDKDMMNIKGDVRVILEDATIVGRDLVYDMESEGTFTGNVSAEIQGEKSSIKISSDYLKFNTKRKVYIGWSDEGKVRIWKGKIYTESKRFKYSKDTGVVELTGGVFIHDIEKDVKMWAERALIYLNEDKMKAFKVKTEITTK